MLRVTIAAAVMLVTVAVAGHPTAGGVAPLFVDSAEDVVDADPGNGVCAIAAGPCTLRAAVQEANARPGPDEIILPAGIYALALPGAGEHAAATGDLDITDDLTITGDGRELVTVDGATLDRIFDISGGLTVAISYVTLRNGDSGIADGGGIRNFGGLTLMNVAVVDNTADDAGGIVNYGALTIETSSITGNEAGDVAGGVFNGQDASLTLRRSVIGDNTSALGAGGASNFGTLDITDSTISGNTTSGNGGGLSNFGQASLTNTTVSGNTSEDLDGGGINNEADLTLRNVTVARNAAGRDGGGILNGKGDVALSNTIIADNAAGADCFGAFTSLGHNLDSDGSCGLATIGDLPATDPLLGPLAGNGGPTETHALLATSPAIDAASDACPPPDHDQRGVPRPLDGDEDGTATCDIGAYELQPLMPPPTSPAPPATSTAPVPSPTDTTAAVAALPSTGAGPGPSGNPIFWPLAALIAAAALSLAALRRLPPHAPGATAR